MTPDEASGSRGSTFVTSVAPGTQSTVDDPRERARLIRTMSTLVVAMGVLGTIESLFEARNRLDVTLVYYGTVIASIGVVRLLLRRGMLDAAGWWLTGTTWTAVAVVPLLYGGLQGEIAASYTVMVLIAGVILNGRAATVFAVASVLWMVVVAWLQVRQRLSVKLVPTSPINSIYAAGAAVTLTAILLRMALRALHELRGREREAALQRDEALRRSHEAQKLQLVGNIASGVAHDFNNLLSVMTSAGHVLREETDEAERQAVLDDLESATSRASLMVRHLLAVGRSNQEGTPPLVVDLSRLLRDNAALLPRLLGPRIRLELECGDGLCVRASRSGLEQLVLNLAVNARDAMPKGGTLTLRLRATDREVRLEVSDTGVGIDESTRARIFEPFFSTKDTGTGLGLATVRRVVLEAGGVVEVESTPGAGATFIVTLPRADGAPSPHPARPSVPRPLGESRRVLVVDDDPLVLRSTRRTLEREGYEVVVVGDGDEALALLSAARFDALVSDVSMRRIDGLTLAHECHARWPSLPVLLISGRSLPGEPAPWLRFLPKPVDPAMLLALLARLIEDSPEADPHAGAGSSTAPGTAELRPTGPRR